MKTIASSDRTPSVSVSNQHVSRGGIFSGTNAFGIITIGIVLAGAAFLLMYHLGAEPLQDYDEATYAEVSAESLAAHHYFSLTFLEQNYFRKPPVIFWAMDVSESFIANPEVAARLPSVLSGLLLVALVMLFAYEATESLYVAAATGAMLTTTSAFIEPARQARLDILVSFFIVASVYAFFKATVPAASGTAFPRRRLWYIAFGALLGLAVLTKGPLAVYAVVPVLAIAAAYKTYKWILDPYFWGSVLAFLIVVLPWHIYESFHFGMNFWKEYLGDQILNRVGETLFNGPTNAEYLNYLFSFALPWSLLFCVSIVVIAVLWKWMPLKRKAFSAAALSGVFVIIVICFVTKTKAFSYLIPLYPFMVLTIAVAGYEVMRRIPVFAVRLWLGIGFLILTAGAFELSVYNGFHLNPYYASEVLLAQNEKAIAEKLRAEHAPNFYVYDTTTLGSIMFYSKILQPLGFSIGEHVPSNTFVLFPVTDLLELQSSYPRTLSLVYAGSSLDLGVLKDDR